MRAAALAPCDGRRSANWKLGWNEEGVAERNGRSRVTHRQDHCMFDSLDLEIPISVNGKIDLASSSSAFIGATS